MGDRLYITLVFVRPIFKGIASHLASRLLPDGGWAYFDRTGLVRVKDVAPFDNGASYFHSGLVRVVRDGKYGLASDRGGLGHAVVRRDERIRQRPAGLESLQFVSSRYAWREFVV
jgi:hypothetical protein